MNKKINFLILVFLLIFILSSCQIDLPDNIDKTDNSINLGKQIEEEYYALKNGETTHHTVWTFTGTILDMTATKFNTTYNNYEVRMILDVDGVYIGIYNGQVNNMYPSNIEGLEVGVKVQVIGTISENYTLDSGSYHADIEFSKPEISWDYDDSNTNDKNNNNQDTPPVITSGNKVNFLMLNDTHGAFIDANDGYSIARVNSLLDTLTSQKGEYIKIANGDMLQGSYISSKTHGLSIIESLNLMDFDAFVIGNHEFDWGLDKIAKYKDGDISNGEANFPFLGANIFYKDTTTRPEWIDPYTIVDYNGIKVGIIGVIGGYQESDILKANISAYEFLDDPTQLIKNYVRELRTSKECDVVVVATHDYNNSLNNNIANFSGDYNLVDAIFCAHTHWLVNEQLSRSDGVSIPVVQNNDKNETAQEVIIKLDDTNKMVSFENRYYRLSTYGISAKFDSLFEKYNSLITEGERTLGYTSSTLSRSDLGYYVTESMARYDFSNNFGNVNVGVVNTGGVRAEITSGDITVSDVFNTFPFENEVILVKLYGRDVKKIISNSYLYNYTNISTFSDNSIYIVGIVDYAFYDSNNEYIFNNAIEIFDTNILMRDIFIEYISKNFN